MRDNMKKARLPDRRESDEPPSDLELLHTLLDERIQYPRQADQIDAKLRQAFERVVAVLILDMCGFSQLTAHYGIIHFLCMIRQMELGAVPAVEGNGGTVIKQEADNLFAVFETAEQALEAALDIFHAFDAMNDILPDERDIRGSVGIGFGRTLVIGREEFFGPEVNLASKLGEDVAGKMEILLTDNAHKALPPGRYECSHKPLSLGELQIQAFGFLRRL